MFSMVRSQKLLRIEKLSGQDSKNLTAVLGWRPADPSCEAFDSALLLVRARVARVVAVSNFLFGGTSFVSAFLACTDVLRRGAIFHSTDSLLIAASLSSWQHVCQVIQAQNTSAAAPSCADVLMSGSLAALEGDDQCVHTPRVPPSCGRWSQDPLE